MSEPALLTANQVDPASLQAFLERVYPPPKSEFIIRYGSWLHKNDQNRLVIVVDGQLAGYCALIPTMSLIGGKILPALFWVDLIIAPEFRGQGLQTLFDRRIREMSDILLGFPNELAAEIHRKHGWGVCEDMELFLLALKPHLVKSVRAVKGWRGLLLRAGAWGLEIPASIWCTWLSKMQPGCARLLTQPDPDLLTGVYERWRDPTTNTTHRDLAYITWRFFQSPDFSEYRFFTAGPLETPTHYLVTRHMQKDGVLFTRFIDIFGDFKDLQGLGDLLLAGVQDAIHNQSSQITMMISIPELRPVLRNFGFLIHVPVGFCWQCQSEDIMRALYGRNHWSLADSDNDLPD